MLWTIFLIVLILWWLGFSFHIAGSGIPEAVIIDDRSSASGPNAAVQRR